MYAEAAAAGAAAAAHPSPAYRTHLTAYFATCAKGLEPVLAEELGGLDAGEVAPGTGGVAFRGEEELLYRANLWLRTANRVLVPLAEFACGSEAELYAGVRRLPWHERLTPEMTLAVEATLRDSALRHSGFVALKTKDAIVDQIRDRRGARPSVDVRDPSVRVHVRLFRDRATVSLDASGGSLHERGYRVAGGEAPLKETLAAGLVLLSGWRPGRPLVDPMCGTGTLAIEAALLAGDVAPGLLRGRFGFFRWREHQARLWQRLVREAEARRAAGAAAAAGAGAAARDILASDRDPRAVAAALRNARAAGVLPRIAIERRELAEVRPPAGPPGVVLVNPPYGERLGDARALAPLYTALGDLLKRHFAGWSAEVLSANPALTKAIGLRTSRRLALYNGPLECRLLRYGLF